MCLLEGNIYMIILLDYSYVFTDGTCDCVKEIFILQIDRTVAVCLRTVRVTALRKYLYGKLTEL